MSIYCENELQGFSGYFILSSPYSFSPVHPFYHGGSR